MLGTSLRSADSGDSASSALAAYDEERPTREDETNGRNAHVVAYFSPAFAAVCGHA